MIDSVGEEAMLCYTLLAPGNAVLMLLMLLVPIDRLSSSRI